jgi:hypothetical protein
MRVSLKSAGWDGRHKSVQREALSLCPRVSFRFPLGDNLISVLQLRALTGFVTEGQDIAEYAVMIVILVIFVSSARTRIQRSHCCQLVAQNGTTSFRSCPVK